MAMFSRRYSTGRIDIQRRRRYNERLASSVQQSEATSRETARMTHISATDQRNRSRTARQRAMPQKLKVF